MHCTDYAGTDYASTLKHTNKNDAHTPTHIHNNNINHSVAQGRRTGCMHSPSKHPPAPPHLLAVVQCLLVVPHGVAVEGDTLLERHVSTLLGCSGLRLRRLICIVLYCLHGLHVLVGGGAILSSVTPESDDGRVGEQVGGGGGAREEGR